MTQPCRPRRSCRQWGLCTQNPVEQYALAVIPHVPAAEDLLQRAVAHRFPQDCVHRVAQRGVRSREHANVVADGDRLRQDDEAGAPPAAQCSLRDDVIQQHRIHPALHEVSVGMDVIVVGNRDDAGRVARREEQIVGDRRAERRDAPAAQIRQTVDAARVLWPYGQHFAEFEIGDRDGVLRATRRRVLDAGEAEREIPTFDRLVDVRPLHLHEPGSHRSTAESARDALGDLHVKAADPRGIRGVGFDEGGTPFRISPPHKHARSPILCGETREQAERELTSLGGSDCHDSGG